ncbi:MAG: hypothetical protein WCY88_11855 [Spongiibacteraceae bacterium]
MLIEDSEGSVVAIDLGSNSFHLLEAKLSSSGKLHAVNARAHKVQLGLDMVDRQLSASAIQRGLACIQQFSSYTQGRNPACVKVVGTQALRLATNKQDFIVPASEMLGQPINIVSGEEEACLAYTGVAAELTGSAMRLVIDVGGGSTEFGLGRGVQFISGLSVAVGCVSWLQYFQQGVISADSLACAQQAASEEFARILPVLAKSGSAGPALRESAQFAVGCSGTLQAVEQVLTQQRWSVGGITRQGLERLKQALLNFDSIDAVSFQGLREERRSIFATGVAIVLALFEVFQFQSVRLSSAGLREGIAWQLLHPG